MDRITHSAQTVTPHLLGASCFIRRLRLQKFKTVRKIRQRLFNLPLRLLDLTQQPQADPQLNLCV